MNEHNEGLIEIYLKNDGVAAGNRMQAAAQNFFIFTKIDGIILIQF